MRSWTNSPERTFASREQAAAFYACLIWCREWSRRLKTGQAMTTIEEVCREAVERAGNARIDVDSIPSEGGEMGEFAEQTLSDSGEGEHRPTNARRLSRDTAGHVFPVRFARQAEYEIDRIVSDLECGEGEGE